MPGTGVRFRVAVPLLPPAGPLRRYAVVTMVDSAGTGLFLTGSTLFFTRVVGLSVGQVGLGLSLAGLAALLGAVPLGSLGDRLGHRGVWVTLTLVEAMLFAAYPWVRSFPVFVVVVALVAMADVGASPIRSAYLSRIAGSQQRVRAKAYNQVISNVGFSLGALGAGVALHVDTRTAYVTLVLGNAISYAVAAGVLLTLPGGQQPAGGGSGRVFAVFRDRSFLVVAVLNGLLMIYGAVLTVALPLWVVQRTQAPRWSVAGVFLLNTVLVVGLQVRASRGAETVRGAARASRRAGVLLLLGCAVLSVSGAVGSRWALVAVGSGGALLTLGELLQSAGSWGLSYGLAPEARQGEYLGAFAMGSRSYDAVGPVLVVGLILGLGTAGWWLLGALFLGLGAALVPASGWAERNHSTRAGSARVSRR